MIGVNLNVQTDFGPLMSNFRLLSSVACQRASRNAKNAINARTP
jgi:hypothetical protein